MVCYSSVSAGHLSAAHLKRWAAMLHRSGRPKDWKVAAAKALVAAGDFQKALSHLQRSCFAVGYDTEYFELLGRALLGCGNVVNAGRFLFLSGKRESEYAEAIALYLSRNSDRKNHRQLQSSFPHRVRVMWKLHQFPAVVADELRALGWPECSQPKKL